MIIGGSIANFTNVAATFKVRDFYFVAALRRDIMLFTDRSRLSGDRPRNQGLSGAAEGA